MTIRAAAVATIFSVFAASLAQAAPITVIVEGVTASYEDPDNLLPFDMPAPGDTWKLSLTYDTRDFVHQLVGDVVPDPNTGVYPYPGTDMRLVIAGQEFSSLDPNILIINDQYNGPETVDNWIASASDLQGSFNLVLYNTAPGGQPATPLDSDALVPPAALDEWLAGQISYNISGPFDPETEEAELLARATATVTSLSVVPIPAAVWLFASALGLGGVLARRSSRS